MERQGEGGGEGEEGRGMVRQGEAEAGFCPSSWSLVA